LFKRTQIGSLDFDDALREGPECEINLYSRSRAETDPRLHLDSTMPKEPIEIDCEEVWRQISNYLDDEVDSELRAVLASHFKNCSHCSAVLDGTRNVVKLVGDGRAFELPASAGQNLYKKLNHHLSGRQRKKR